MILPFLLDNKIMVMPVYDRRGNELIHGMPHDTIERGIETGKKITKGVRKAGEALRTAFGGGAITGESADRRQPTEQMMIGNPMAHPMAADSVKMPQDLQAGYMHMNRFGSPLPIHGLGTPGRTTMAQDIQDGNLVMQHRMQVANRDPIGMSRIPFGAIA